LFSTGEEQKQPPLLAGEHLYLFPASEGYDGQMYHYIAHDPFFERGLNAYVDAPRVRYRRILIPLAAHILALGRDQFIDGAYLGVILFAIFCGGYWLSVYCSTAGLSPWLGFLFLLIPATLVSMDRLTVDVALVALCIAFAIFVDESRWPLFGVLVASTLVRETGFLLLAGYVISLLWNRKLRTALIFSTAAIPALAWYAFVQLETYHEDVTAFSWIPFQGIAERFVHPYQYPFGLGIAAVSTILDYAALAGIVLAVALAVRTASQRLTVPIATCIYLFTLFAAFLFSPGAWEEVYAFGRTLSPLLVLLAIWGLPKRSWIHVLPLALVVPRTLIQLGPQAVGVLRGVL
jgi:hypothetical protein